jgi:hypothetical protein
MYQEVWSCAVDCMCYELFAGCFLEPGHIVCRHGSDAMHLSKWEGACLRDKHIASYIDLHADLYAVDIAFYSLDVVLRPLAAALAEDAGRNPDAALQADFHACLGDLLEAFPYLCASKRTSRYTFPVRGTTCMAAFRFLARGGFGVFMFFDSEDNMRAGLEIGVCRAALTIDFDGTIGALMHPWLTVGNILTSTDGLRTSHWLISQVRDQIVEDYLKINRYFLQPNLRDGVPGSGPGVSEGANDPVDCAEWARELREPVDAGPGSSIAAVVASVRLGPFLPQIRRSRFFRVLRLCGVEIVQGKGSEIKLLRGDAHPFRLGSHYGPNPTIPSFLAGRILKRLGVSRDEWTSAIRASGL